VPVDLERLLEQAYCLSARDGDQLLVRHRSRWRRRFPRDTLDGGCFRRDGRWRSLRSRASGGTDEEDAAQYRARQAARAPSHQVGCNNRNHRGATSASGTAASVRVRTATSLTELT
jgi:hypothetical protein